MKSEARRGKPRGTLAKASRYLVLLFATLLAACTISAHAVTLETSVETEVRVTSAYVWRGRVINDEPCIQPSITVGAGDLSFNVWGTWDLTDVANSSGHTRMDTTLDYSHRFARQILSSGLIAYIYHDEPEEDKEDTFEAFVGYAADVLLLPSLTVYYDFGEIEGFYGEFGLAHSFGLLDNILALDLGVSMGVADKEYSSINFNFPANDEEGIEEFVPDKASLGELMISASFPVSIGTHCMITPAIKYMSLLDPDIRDAAENVGKEDEIVYSLTLGLYF